MGPQLPVSCQQEPSARSPELSKEKVDKKGSCGNKRPLKWLNNVAHRRTRQVSSSRILPTPSKGIVVKTLLSLALMAGIGLFLAGCQKSVVEEKQEVREAQEQAQENIAEEQQDVREAAKEGAAEVAEERDDVRESAAE